MPKKCNNCNFVNPDAAHYCAECGSALSDADNYKVYNAATHTAVKKSALREYDTTAREYARYVKKVQSSWLLIKGETLGEWWRKCHCNLILMCLIAIGLVASAIYIHNTNKPEDVIHAVKVGGKYGIGYNKKLLLVPAIYDKVTPRSGNQWVLEAGTNQGLAYLSDSISIIEPDSARADYIAILSNGLAALRINGNYRFAKNGRFASDTMYDLYYYPTSLLTDFLSGQTRRHEGECIIARFDGGEQLLGEDGLPLGGITYRNIYIDSNDSIIRAEHYPDKTNKQAITTLHDFSGNQTCDISFEDISPFYDGKAMAKVVGEYLYTLVDKNGKKIH